MVNGYDTYKLHLALHAHFTNPDYDVFKKNGSTVAGIESYEKRKDKLFFEAFGNRFPNQRKVVECMVANIAYGNSKMIYDLEKAMYNYNIWRKRKDSIGKVFHEDLFLIESFEPDSILFCGMTIESKVIMNKILPYIDDVGRNALTTSKIMLIRKLEKFVKYDMSKIKNIFDNHTFK